MARANILLKNKLFQRHCSIKISVYALRMRGRTGCVFINKGEAEKLAGCAFNREDPPSEVTLGVSF
jgi:hypothetical protein